MNGLNVLGKDELQFASQSRSYKQPKTVNYCLCYHTVLTTASWRERHPKKGKRESIRQECGNGHLGHQQNNSHVEMATFTCKLCLNGLRPQFKEQKKNPFKCR